MEMKIPWEWTWEKYVEKSRKVEIKMQSVSKFSLCSKNGEWDTVSGVGTNVGEKLVGKISKISGFFFGKFCCRNGLGTSGRA